MYYYEVWVRTPRYRGKTALTYSHTTKLVPGSIVAVPLQREMVTGVIVKQATARPMVTIKSIATIYDLPPLPRSLLAVAAWVLTYYRSAVGAIAQTIIPPAIPIKPLEPTTPPDVQPPRQLPVLNAEQAAATKAMSGASSYLLHGRTGSGKTRIYQEVAKAQTASGHSVLVLSPEIGLTSQLVASFESLGIAPVINLHSGMTGRQRFIAWRTILEATQPLIVVGARSALFSPLKNIGLIVVDEFHEMAYKQEQEPRYHAVRVAAVLAREHQSILIYGSATPQVVDYRLAEETQTPIIPLTTVAVSHNVVTKTIVVDLKNRSNFTQSSLLSNALIQAIEQSLQRSEQSLLYLNRRGTARVSLCPNCGWQAVCPHCDLPMTYHGDSHLLRCHSCNTTQLTPSSCPVCKHTEILFRGAGTKAVVEETQRLFPKARIIRFDSDNKAAETLEAQYEPVKRGDADILVGTQTLAKGLDLPLLSTLGVITAETSLQLPDFTANERTFQLLSQVLGRVGRGHRQATAVIQSYSPDSPLLQAAISNDWDGFYSRELEERRLFSFPPFYQLLVVRCRRASAASAERTCNKVVTQLNSLGLEIDIEGPAPALHERSAAGYTWQIIVKARKRAELLKIVDALPSTVTSYDLDPVNLL
jgi:primosomal protein N' (replication factor Y)